MNIPGIIEGTGGRTLQDLESYKIALHYREALADIHSRDYTVNSRSFSRIKSVTDARGLKEYLSDLKHTILQEIISLNGLVGMIDSHLEGD